MSEEKPRPLLQLKRTVPKPVIQGTRLEHERDTTDTFFDRIQSYKLFQEYTENIKKEAEEKAKKKAEEDKKKDMEKAAGNQKKVIFWTIVVIALSPIIGRTVEALAKKIFGF